jgi:cytochrome P450
MYPTNPVAAACHDNPYPYYNSLLKGSALVFDEQLKLWIASSAAVVYEVLGNPYCAVRPSTEQVPKAIVGSSAGGIFSHLIRMNEGPAHERPKFALQKAFGTLDIASIKIKISELGTALAKTYGLPESLALTPWISDLPIYVVADLLGFGRADLPQIARWMTDFVRCLSPLSSSEQLAAASEAAENLLQRFKLLIQTGAVQESSLLSRIQHEAALVGWDNMDSILANLIGLLSQTYEATAGLIGNSLVALLTLPNLQDRLRNDPNLAEAMVQEVCRFDPPVQNTRRFVTQATTVANITLQAGDAILLLLAAAGRDEDANYQPNDFLLERTDRQWFGFGHGRHACPGQNLAFAIASAAIQSILAMPLHRKRSAQPPTQTRV